MAKQESTERDAAELKRQRKAAKMAAKQADAAGAVVSLEADDDEAKRQRKAAKKAAKAAAAIESAGPAVEVDEIEAKKQRKAAKKAAKETLAMNDVPPEVTEAEAKRQRKADKKAAKEAAAAEAGAAVEEQDKVAQKGSKKRVAEAEIGDDIRQEAKKMKKTKAGQSEKERENLACENGDDRTAFIRGLPWAATQDVLQKDFVECGEIENIKMPKNEEGKPRGFAFVKFVNQEGCNAALKFDNTQYGGRTIYVCKAGTNTKGKGKDGTGSSKNVNTGRNNPLTLCIKGLPYSIEVHTLQKDFAECGEIEKANMHKNKENEFTGMAFVTFKSQAGCDAALKFNETEYGGRTITVTKPWLPGDGKGKSKDEGKSKDGGKGKSKGKSSKGKKGKDGKSKDTDEIDAAALEAKETQGEAKRKSGAKKQLSDSSDEDAQ